MLDISSNNLFIIRDSSARYGMVDVLNFYDTEGINWIFLHRDNSTLRHVINNRSIVYSPNGLSDIFGGRNLFRVDLVVIESTTDILEEARKYINLPIIVVGDLSFAPRKKGSKGPAEYSNRFNLESYENSYEFFCNKSDSNSTMGSFNITSLKTTYMVEDIKTKNVYNIEHLKVARIRDKKIDKLLD
jgi:hypothetical protein